jgi:hypothetical protein
MSLRGYNMRGKGMQPESWTHQSRTTRLVKPKIMSWWADYAQPDQREHFMEAAATRTRERQQQEDLRDARTNQMLKHIIDPKNHPPRSRRG